IRWIQRLPIWFTAYFLLFMLVLLFLLSFVLRVNDLGRIAELLLQTARVPTFLVRSDTLRMGLEGGIFLVLLVIATLLSYNAAVLAYRRTPVKYPQVVVGTPLLPSPGRASRLRNFNRVGIVLAGGGAKGAYQAGAMKAIYEFLEENNALDKVKM